MWISRARFDELKQHVNELLTQLKKLENRPYLIDIERQGRTTRFLFARGKQVHEIKTMSLMSDDLKKWKDDLLR